MPSLVFRSTSCNGFVAIPSVRSGVSLQDHHKRQPSSQAKQRVNASFLLRHVRMLSVLVFLTGFVTNPTDQEGNEVVVAPPAWTVGASSGLSPFQLLAYGLLVKFVLFDRFPWLLNRAAALRKSTNNAMKQVASKEILTSLRTSLSRTFVGRNENEPTGPKRVSLLDDKYFFSSIPVGSFSLKDLSNGFRHAMGGPSLAVEATDSLSSKSRIVVQELEAAVVRALAPLEWSPRSSSTFGGTDAMMFVGVLRMFAEWRTERLVPEGYHRYSYVMGLARGDMLKNIRKIENSVHEFMKSSDVLKRPSLDELIQFEIRNGLHPNLPVLCDNSGTSGLLWSMRQLDYQLKLFQNTIRVPFAFPNSKSAALAAYDVVYGRYHNFLTKKIFQGSFGVAPEGDVVLSRMREVDEDASRATASSSLSVRYHDSEELHEHVMLQGHHPVTSPIDAIVSTIKNWHRAVIQCGAEHEKSHSSRNALSSVTETVSEPRGNSSSRGSRKGDLSYNADIKLFVEVVGPWINDFLIMAQKWNINDPSRA